MKKIKRQISIFVVCISLFFVVGSIVINTYASSYKYDWTKCGKADVTSEFLNKVSEICGRLGASPDDLMSVMAFESSLDHRTVNYGSGATGFDSIYAFHSKRIRNHNSSIKKYDRNSTA